MGLFQAGYVTEIQSTYQFRWSIH